MSRKPAVFKLTNKQSFLLTFSLLLSQRGQLNSLMPRETNDFLSLSVVECSDS